MQKQYRNLFILCLIVAVGSFAMGFAVRRYSAHRPGSRTLLAMVTGGRGLSSSPSQTFAAVLESVEDSFVDRIDNEKPLTYGALRQMVDELDDPNSRFLDPEETRDVLDARDGVFHGIGAVVNIEATRLPEGERRRVIVANVLPGSPAAKSGLRVGDVIVKINDKWVYQPYGSLRVSSRAAAGETPAKTEAPEAGEPVEVVAPEAETSDPEDFILFSTHDIMRRLSADGEKVSLMVLGPNAKSLERLDVQTGPTTVRAATVVQVENGVAEVRMGGFTKTVGPDLDAALAEVKRSGAKKLVLDMRGCVGGSVDRAVQVASRFMDGPIGTLERKQNGRKVKVTLTADRERRAWDGPTVVLVDHSTLGTAELLAAALANKGRATLVGAKTFGDGMEQTVIPLRDGSSLLLTTGMFYATNGESYQAKGISPGVVASAREQVNAAHRLLAKKG